MSDLTPGTRVRVLRPDRPEHGMGVVVHHPSLNWAVWVVHRCDCWERGTVTNHMRGYDSDELAPDE